MKEIRLLKPNEIDVRVGTINEKGATLLLYKDARVDMNILDETYGNKWKRSHELINGNLFCTISIYDEDLKEWISRQDVGVESNTEKEKGQASDAFKRAGFNFGIGRELYSAPFTWINGDNYSTYKNPNTGKLATYDKFAVESIGYDDNKEINQLDIKNTKTGRVVFSLGKKLPTPRKSENPSKDVLARAKKQINETLVEQNYLTVDAKREFINSVLGHDSINNLNEADQVMDQLENIA